MFGTNGRPVIITKRKSQLGLQIFTGILKGVARLQIPADYLL